MNNAPKKQTAQQIRLSRTPIKNEKISYNMQQKNHAKTQGIFKGDTVNRDKQYELDIKYIQGITPESIHKEWANRIEAIIEHHESDTKNIARFKTSTIKTVHEFKQYQKKHDDALAKMLDLL